MTVSSATSKVVGSGNGVTTLWPFAFKVFQPGDLEVVYTDAAGIETSLAPGDYVVQLNASQSTSPGGGVVYPASGTPIAAGTRLTIRRVLPLTQPTDLKNQGGFYPEIVETALDRLGMQVQQTDERGARALYTPASDPPPASLPAAARRAGKVLGFDAAGDPAVYAPASAVTDAANVTYSPAGAGAAPLTVEGWIRDNRISVKDYGARGDGAGDQTASFQNAIDRVAALGGGTVYIPPGSYRLTGTLAVTTDGIHLQGASRQTVVTFDNGAGDSIVFGDQANLKGNWAIRDLCINHTAKTGGTAVKMVFGATMLMDNVIIDHPWNGCYFERTNGVTLRDCNINDVKGSYGAKWYANAGSGHRSDVLTFFNTVIQCAYNGGDGFLWDGPCHTLRVFGLALLGVRYGMWVRNTAASASLYPAFGLIFDLETDGCSKSGVRIEGGSDFYFTNCDLANASGSAGQGNADDQTVVILPDSGKSETRDILFSNCRIGNTRKEAISCGARDVHFNNCLVGDASKTGVGSFPAARVTSTARRISITGGQWGALFGQPVRTSHGLVIDNAAAGITINGVDFSDNLVGAIQNNSTDAEIVVLGCRGSVDARVQVLGNNPTIISRAGDIVLTGASRTVMVLHAGIDSAFQVRQAQANTRADVRLFAAGTTGDLFLCFGDDARFDAGLLQYQNATDKLLFSIQGNQLFSVSGALSLIAEKPIGLKSYTSGTLPSASPAGQLIYVSNDGGGPVVAFSDGTSWRRVTDRVVIS